MTMYLKIMKIVTGVVVLIFLSIPTQASFEDKVQLEMGMESKVNHILAAMFGENRATAVVTVDLGEDAWRVRYTERANIRMGNAPAARGSETFKVLPGYDAIKNLSPNEQTQLPFNSMITKVDGSIRKVVIEIVSDKTVSRASVQKAGQQIFKTLGLNEQRGDKIEYSSITFPVNSNPILALDGDTSNQGSSNQGSNKLFVVLLMLLILFLGLYMSYQRKLLAQLDKIANSSEAAAAASPMPAIAAALSNEKESVQTAALGGASDRMLKYFDYVSSDNIDKLIAILKNENLNDAHLSIIASFLPAALAAKLIVSRSEQEQSAIISRLTEEKVLDKDSIAKLDELVKRRLECVTGGSIVLSKLFAKFENAQKIGLLERMKSSPEQYAILRAYIILFEDIQYLSDADCKKVVSDLNLDLLSTALMGASKRVQLKIEKGLSPAALSMVRQFSELRAAHISKQQIEAAQEALTDRLNQMDNDGVIALRTNIPKSANQEA